MHNTKLKMLTATAGAAALLAMGGVSIATSYAEPDEVAPGPVDASEATTGATSTVTTAESTPAMESAAPEITGPAPLPPELEGIPG